MRTNQATIIANDKVVAARAHAKAKKHEAKERNKAQVDDLLSNY